MKDYVAENERILGVWRKNNEKFHETKFADDGIMYRGKIEQIENGTERYSNKELENRIWNDAPLRILFLTKDQNAGSDEACEAWDVRGETGNLSYTFFRNLMYQLYGLVHAKPEFLVDYNDFTNAQAIELYNTFPIARINAKKEAGTSSIMNQTLRDYIERDKDLLKEQILNLDADIISGQVERMDNHQLLRTYDKSILMQLFYDTLNHQGTFIKHALFDDLKYDENYKIVSDWKFWLETIIWRNASLEIVDLLVAKQDVTGISSDINYIDLQNREIQEVLDAFFPIQLQKELKEYQKLRVSPYAIWGNYLQKKSQTLYNIGYQVLKFLVKFV